VTTASSPEDEPPDQAAGQTDKHIDAGPDLVERVRNEILKSLFRFSMRVSRVQVHLGDQNADRDGNEFGISRATGRVVSAFRRGSFVVTVLDGRPPFMPWVVWLIVAVVLGVAEFFTLTLAFGLLAAAALVAAIVAGLGGSLLAQVLAFMIAGGVGLLIVRPIARRQMTRPSLVREGSYALVGKRAVVIEEVSGTQGQAFRGGRTR